jgi:hypothetical protein
MKRGLETGPRPSSMEVVAARSERWTGLTFYFPTPLWFPLFARQGRNLAFVSNVVKLECRALGRGRCHCHRGVVEGWEPNPPLLPGFRPSKQRPSSISLPRTQISNWNAKEENVPTTRTDMVAFWALPTALSPKHRSQASAKLHRYSRRLVQEAINHLFSIGDAALTIRVLRCMFSARQGEPTSLIGLLESHLALLRGISRSFPCHHQNPPKDFERGCIRGTVAYVLVRGA